MAFDLPTLNKFMARRFTDLPVTVIWGSLTYANFAKSSPSFSQTLEIGGIDQKIDAVFFARTSDILAQSSTLPKEGAVFIVGGVNHQVLNVKTSPDGQLLTFSCTFARTGTAPWP
jgi:hypothetical protein